MCTVFSLEFRYIIIIIIIISTIIIIININIIIIQDIFCSVSYNDLPHTQRLLQKSFKLFANNFIVPWHLVYTCSMPLKNQTFMNTVYICRLRYVIIIVNWCVQYISVDSNMLQL